MKSKKLLYIIFVVVATANAGQHLSLKEAENKAVDFSKNISAAKLEAQATLKNSDALFSVLLPKISLEGTYRYVDKIPTMNVPLGAHNNYSIGPMLYGLLWDFGGTYKNYLAYSKNTEIKNSEIELTKKQTLLALHLNYFKIQMRKEQKKLIGDSLALSESQYKDVQKRQSAGSANRIDLLLASKEVLNLKLLKQQVQTDLDSDLLELSTLLGLKINETEWDFDTIETSMKEYAGSFSQNMYSAENHPTIKNLTNTEEAISLSIESIKASHFPKLTYFAKTSYDYPNGPILEKINQNIIGLNLSMPLFEFNKTTNEVSAKELQVHAIHLKKEQAISDLQREGEKIILQLNNQREKVEILNKLVFESGERARLVYSSYQLGRLSFLEVQTANLHALEAKVQATMNDAQILISCASLENYFGIK